MATNDQIKDYLRNIQKMQDSRLATQMSAGLMSAADKVKLDNIQVDFESGTLSILTSKGILTFAAIRGNNI